VLLPKLKTKKKYGINFNINIYKNGRILEKAVSKYIGITV